MYKRSFAHHTRRRSDASCQPDNNLIEIFLRSLVKLLDDGSDRVFFSLLDDFAALEFVWIDVADEFAQRFEMFAPRKCLIVLFDERNRQCALSKKGRLYRHTTNPVIFR